MKKMMTLFKDALFLLCFSGLVLLNIVTFSLFSIIYFLVLGIIVKCPKKIGYFHIVRIPFEDLYGWFYSKTTPKTKLVKEYKYYNSYCKKPFLGWKCITSGDYYFEGSQEFFADNNIDIKRYHVFGNDDENFRIEKFKILALKMKYELMNTKEVVIDLVEETDLVKDLNTIDISE